MTTPKERAAKAIAQAQYYTTDPALFLENAAFAALSAIAEPSEAMIRAGDLMAISKAFRLDTCSPAAIWRAMHAVMMAEKDDAK